MKERRAFKQNKDIKNDLRKEWVSLVDGDVCVWELMTPESVLLAERSRRPAIDTRGGMDETAATAWLIALSVHHSDEPDSPRVWDDLAIADTLLLRSRDTNLIVGAFRRVNGTSEEELEAVTDFSPATGAQNPSESTVSASSNSAGSRAKSPSRTTS